MRIERDKIDETRSGTSMAIPSLVLVDKSGVVRAAI
jgi:hypothetical protein